jgi:hypothetical protein
MRQIAQTYSYNSSTKVLTLTGVNVPQGNIVSILNATASKRVYSVDLGFIDAISAYTQAANSTVTFRDGSGFSNSDVFNIIYDDGATSTITIGLNGSITNLSSTITSGGTSQQIVASNTSRRYFAFQNTSDTAMYLGIGYTPTTSNGLLMSASGGGIVFESNFIPTQAVNVLCATTGKTFVALEA